MPASFVYVCVNNDVYSNCLDSAVILCCFSQLSCHKLVLQFDAVAIITMHQILYSINTTVLLPIEDIFMLLLYWNNGSKTVNTGGISSLFLS